MVEVREFHSNKLSTFRTDHVFTHYGEFTTVDEYTEYREWAEREGLPVFILGNGSNTLFMRRKVNTLVLKNRLNEELTDLGDGRVRASSSVKLMRILRLCEKQSRSCFYFLASVPATVGGAIAMNAGMAHETIFDFVESVTYLDGTEQITLENDQIEREHRRTMFTGVQDRLVVSVVFRFDQMEGLEGEIRKRIEWAKARQDLGYPNCGSIFRKCNYKLMAYVRKFRIPVRGIAYPLFHTQWSKMTPNWIITRSKSSKPIIFLIRLVQLLHRLTGSRAEVEVIEVD